MPDTSPQSPRSLVKICGVTRKDQAEQILSLGADFLGINFWPQSKRYLRPEDALWLRELSGTPRLVGVFVNPGLDYLDEIASMGVISQFQLHGDETPDFCAALQAKGLTVIKAFQVKDEAMLNTIGDFPVSGILLDAYHPDERGGLGHTFPWELALSFKRKYPDRSLYLAGGLTPENVQQAVAGVQPYAVDVASGVEAGIPGVKDLGKVGLFIRQARTP